MGTARAADGAAEVMATASTACLKRKGTETVIAFDAMRRAMEARTRRRRAGSFAGQT